MLRNVFFTHLKTFTKVTSPLGSTAKSVQVRVLSPAPAKQRQSMQMDCRCFARFDLRSFSVPGGQQEDGDGQDQTDQDQDQSRQIATGVNDGAHDAGGDEGRQGHAKDDNGGCGGAALREKVTAQDHQGRNRRALQKSDGQDQPAGHPQRSRREQEHHKQRRRGRHRHHEECLDAELFINERTDEPHHQSAQEIQGGKQSRVAV